jgi:hypothetical protein
VALNALALSTLWILRFLTAFPLFLAVDQSSQAMWLLYLVSFMVFMMFTFAVSIVQIFALNAMVLQGASVSDALIRGYVLFKKHWVVTVETAVLLFLIAVGISILFIGLFMIATIPFIAIIIAASALKSATLLYGTIGVGLALLLVGLFVVSSFATQFQYATWTYLYRRLGEGGVLPKLHRWYRALSGSYIVPQR